MTAFWLTQGQNNLCLQPISGMVANIEIRSVYHKLVPRFLRELVHPIVRPKVSLLRIHARYHSGGAVVSGPFAGLRFNNKYFDLPKVLGTYEIEIHPVFERLRNRSFRTVVDVGAAEGYYAVGMLLWNKECSVIAYEGNTDYHESIRYLARANNVEHRLDLRGLCDETSLRGIGDELAEAFMIVDVEGYEKTLLNPETVPALRAATILVEVHDCFVEGCTETLRQRFSPTHHITSYTSRDRFVSEYPVASGLMQRGFMQSTVVKAIGDGRTEINGWLLLEPKNG